MKFLSNFSPYKIERNNQSVPMNLLLDTRHGNLVSIIGFWIHNSGISLEYNGRVTKWLTNICIFSFIITTISQLITIIQEKNDMAKMFENFGVISFCSMGLLKLYSLRGSQQLWYSLLSSASSLEIQELNKEDPMSVDYESEGEDDVFQKHITKYTKKFVSTSNLLLKVYIITCVIYILSPFIEYVIRKIQGTDVLDYPHILPVWTPLEKIFFPAYLITVGAEVIAAAYCVCVHTVFDLSMVGMMIFIHGQFLLLREYSERIGGEGRKCDLSQEKDLRAHFRISRCQRIHASLIKSVNDLCSLTRNILGFCFNVATLTFCSVAVQLVSDDLSTTQLFTLLQYLCAMLIQLFLFCNYGDAVIRESSVSLGEGPSASAWWCLSPHIRREVALLFVGLTRQCRLMAGPFHFVNLPAFIQIVRTTYSYYAVIRQKSSDT